MKKSYVSLIILFLVLFASFDVYATTCNHEFGEWEVSEQPTCGYCGYKYRVCKLCEYEESETIPKVEHEWGNWEVEEEQSCYSNGTKIRYCLNCDETQSEKIAAYNCHQWGEWKENEQATCGSIGSDDRYCLRCGKYQTKTTPINPDNHKLSAWNYDRPTALFNGEKYRSCDCGEVKQSITIPKLKATVKINKTSLKLRKNKTYKLKIKKRTYGDYVRYWKSSNNKIVTIDTNGKLKAKKKGKAIITLKMASGVRATCKVTVR